MVPHITQSEFADKVENVSYPVLVDFFATWCGPCKMMAPVLDRVALAKQGKARFTRLMSTRNLSLPNVCCNERSDAYRIQRRVCRRQFVGVQSEQALVKALD